MGVCEFVHNIHNIFCPCQSDFLRICEEYGILSACKLCGGNSCGLFWRKGKKVLVPRRSEQQLEK